MRFLNRNKSDDRPQTPAPAAESQPELVKVGKIKVPATTAGAIRGLLARAATGNPQAIDNLDTFLMMKGINPNDIFD